MQYLSFNQLQEKLGGRSRSSIYRDVEASRLPEPIRLGARLYWPMELIEDAMRTAAGGVR